MSFRPTLKRIIGAFAAVAATTAALAQEEVFLAPQASLQRHDPDTLALLGRRLFFDVRLSRTGTTACASCHDPAYYFAEPRRVSISDTGRRGRRNAPSLVNVGFLPTLMWDGRFRKLEQQALGPFLRGEMGITVRQAVQRLNADSDYVRLFYRALHRPPTADGMARALAAYQRSLTLGESRVERFLRTNDETILAPLERDGLTIFDTRAGCSNCHHLATPPANPRPHAPLLLSDFRFHNLGIGYKSGWFTDPGRFALSHVEADLGAFRTPSLRNVARTGPYMHDGSLTTLEEVVEFYNAGGRPNPYLSPLIRPLLLTDYERAALVAFLRGLTDRELAPFGTQVGGDGSRRYISILPQCSSGGSARGEQGQDQTCGAP
jgi:cytochrome c peroxidase